MNLAFFNDKNIAINSNLLSIHNNTSINLTEKSNEDINSLILVL